MRFITDKQTINDLELFDKVKGERSIFSLFNYTQSFGGKKQLEIWFSSPLNDADLLKQRVEILQHFREDQNYIEIDKYSLDFIEHYLIQQNAPRRYSSSKSFFKAVLNKLLPNSDYYVLQRGIRLLKNTIVELYNYAKTVEPEQLPSFIVDSKKLIINTIENTSLKKTLHYRKNKYLTPFATGKLDYIFRKTEFLAVKELLAIIYEYDAYKAIGVAAKKHNLTLPLYSNEPNYISIKGLIHPFLDNPVSNDIEYKADATICFITGPNMAGKSTFLKSLGVAVYLSHIGFPVPAVSFKTSIFNGLLTTINLSDNINRGYSHYYSEILRVKYVAEQINLAGNVFVVFDELFRGTNVKDAYEASLSVIVAFSKLNKGLFAISTHIIEVADRLKETESIFFKYFEANLLNNIPNYDYKLKDGVTDERIGMYILNKEKVIETIEKSIQPIVKEQGY